MYMLVRYFNGFLVYLCADNRIHHEFSHIYILFNEFHSPCADTLSSFFFFFFSFFKFQMFDCTIYFFFLDLCELIKIMEWAYIYLFLFFFKKNNEINPTRIYKLWINFDVNRISWVCQSGKEWEEGTRPWKRNSTLMLVFSLFFIFFFSFNILFILFNKIIIVYYYHYFEWELLVFKFHFKNFIEAIFFFC